MDRGFEETALTLQPIGIARSPYAEKFGVPRQANLARKVETTIVFDPRRVEPAALRGLLQVSHVWVLFWFHLVNAPSRASTVRPPRLGGNAVIGTFATRSPFRPNPIGMSLLEIIEVGEMQIRLRGGDLVDGTPVLDIKPYVAYTDCAADAHCEWVKEAPPALVVRCSPDVERRAADDPAFAQALAIASDILAFDPRPAYQKDSEVGRIYAATLAHLNLHFRVDERGVEIIDANDVTQSA
jgi:tRNA-Thr(GGU) m(6)t(6)A37 methyltransferase TsaA